MVSERDERRGPKGDKGERGEQGKAGTRMPARQARAVVYLFVLNVVFVALCFAGLAYYVRAGGQERCGTIAQITAIPAAAGTWGARFEAIERDRLRELGCSR